MTSAVRWLSRGGRPVLVALLSISVVGCTAAVLPGASGAEDPVVVESGEPSAILAAVTTKPVAEPTVVALPEDLRELLAEVPICCFPYLGTSVQRLGATPIDVWKDETTRIFYDHAATGSAMTVGYARPTTGDSHAVDLFDVDLTTGDLRLITTVETDGELAVTRRRDSNDMLVGGIGVDLIDVATGERRQLIEPVEPPEPGSGGIQRTFQWSPTGRTASARLCSIESCVIDIIDTSDWSVSRLPGAHVLLALTDEHALYYASLDDRRPRVLDLATLESRIVSPQLEGLISAYPRDDGGFVLYGVTSWPNEHPVHRPLVHVDPVAETDRVLVDQGPDDWAYPYLDWTSNDWVLLLPELGAGGPPGLRIAIDTRTGERYEFMIDAEGRAVVP